MYTIDQLSNRNIWFFYDRDSSPNMPYFLNTFIRGLNKDSFYIIDRPNQPLPETIFEDRVAEDDYDRVICTNNFSALKSLSKYTNPIVIRFDSRNKADRFIINRNIVNHLAGVLDEPTAVWGLQDGEPAPKMTVFIEKEKQNQILWDTYATAFENETIYTEDLEQGYTSNILPNTLTIESETDSSIKKDMDGLLGKTPLLFKLPQNYKELITNYNSVEQYINSQLNTN